MVDQNDDSDPQENGLFNNTRRQFVAGSVALGGLAVGTGLAVPSLAQDDEAPPEPIPNEFEDDVDILNFALTLERLEAAFYQQGLENFDEEELSLDGAANVTEDGAAGEGTNVTSDDGTNVTSDDGTNVSSDDGTNVTDDETAGEDTNVTSDDGTNVTDDEAAGEGTNVSSDDGTNMTSDDGTNVTSDNGTNMTSDDGTNVTSDDTTDQAMGQETEVAGSVLEELEKIQEHEEQHVDTLQTTIEDLDGEPAPEPELDFGAAVEDPMTFLETAVQLEDIGVSAYAGAAPFIENEDLVAPALSIHSVEGRHAAFLRTLVGRTAFPNAFDQARSRSEVLELAGQFVTNIEAFEPSEEAAEDDESRATPEISIEDFHNRTEGGVENETDGGIGNETGGNVTGGNTTGGNSTDT